MNEMAAAMTAASSLVVVAPANSPAQRSLLLENLGITPEHPPASLLVAA